VASASRRNYVDQPAFERFDRHGAEEADSAGKRGKDLLASGRNIGKKHERGACQLRLTEPWIATA